MASESIEYEIEELLDTSDFKLAGSEVEKGGRAIQGYLSSIKSSESRLVARDNLEMLAMLISRGSCEADSFPWHQLRSYHSRAALSILREDGIPAQVETWRCQLDETRKFHQVPLSFTNGQVQKISSALKRVLHECHDLGYLSTEDLDAAVQPSKIQSSSVSRNRVISDGEFRALASICTMDDSHAGSRDALIFYLGFQGGLRVGEIASVAIKDLHFDGRRGQVTVRVREAGKSRARIVPLENAALIALEDWMELRGSEEGPLLCPLRRNGNLEAKRLSAAAIREICDTRSQEAGVPPFAPQELRRSWELRLRAKRRQSVSKPVTKLPSSPLFGEKSEAPRGAEKIHFPFIDGTGF